MDTLGRLRLQGELIAWGYAMKPTVYEGSEPYIFVSYAHRDAEAVYQVLYELQDRGYRLWYDDGIAPGSEWPEDIARHLDAAEMVIAFITPNSMQSQNCRREINFSLSREKHFLSILLEPTDMPLGMQMQLSAQQSIVRHNYDSWDGFIKKVLSSPDIIPCQAPPEPEPEPQPEPKPEPTPEPEPAATPEPEPKPELAPATKPQVVKAPAKPAPAATRDPLPSAQKQPKGSAKIIGIVAAVLVAVLALAFVFGGMAGGEPSFTTSWGADFKQDTSSVTASEQVVTQEDLQSIASCPSLSTLKLTNCDLSACDFSQVTFTGELRTLDLSGSSGLGSYAFLSSLPVKELGLSNCENFSDLSLLDTSKLTNLAIDGTAVGNLNPLANSAIQELDCSNTLVNDLSALSGLASLTTVSAAHTGVTSIEPILSLDKLTAIDFSGCRISWPDKPLAALKLKSARLANTGLTSLAVLSDCSKLTELDVSGNTSLADFSDLDEQNYATLTKLNLVGMSQSAKNLSWIAQCANLEELTLDGNSLGDIDFCKGLENLQHISAVNCKLNGIEALSSCTKLKRMFLACNNIADISSFPALAEISRDTVVDMSYNKLESVASLPAGEYRAILLYGNAENIALSIPEGIAAYEVSVPWCSGIEGSALSHKGDFTSIYLLDCPKKQQVKAKDALGAYAELIDEATLLKMYKDDSFGYPLHYDAAELLSARG